MSDERQKAVDDLVKIYADRQMPEVVEDTDIDTMRGQMLQAMAALSEDRTAASWMDGWDRTLYREQGMWKVLGQALGWPVETHRTGNVRTHRWLSWEDAGAVYFSTENHPEHAQTEVAEAFPTVSPQPGPIRIVHDGIPFDLHLPTGEEEEPPWQPKD